ncbi:MAG TPA: protein kinase [Polyangiaceae bacterium]|jgi:serine/threonine-protein kinase
MPLSPGDHFDRYLVEELLGEGGMARVYRAHDPRLHRRVALKVLRADSSSDPDATVDASARVMREARASAALDHPNAVSVFDVGEADGRLFIAMELVVGKSLRAYVGDASVRWETKLRWLVDAARALGAAHERGLVHRDVKPENVMVRNDGMVKVLDFGIAKRVRVDVQASGTLDDPKTQSIQGGLVGTPWYLSPEQLRGEPVDGRADQFAWGVTAYELLTGSLPSPKGVEGFQLVLSILNRLPDPPSKLLPALPSIVDATIMKALAKAPSQRFESMDGVVMALEGITTSSRRSWADIQVAAMTKTDPAPPMSPQPQPFTTRTEEATTLPTHKPPPRTLLRTAALAIVALAAGAGIAAYSGRVERPGPVTSSNAASSASVAQAATQPTALTDLPPPRSSVPEALAAFRSYQQSFRDADWNAAENALDSAVAHDPGFAAAHLRLAFMRSLESTQEGLVRTSFMQAVRNRSSLDERDAALLDALEPYLEREPTDPVESVRLLEQTRARWPLDAELAYILGSVRYDRGDLGPAKEAFDAAIGIDPAFAQALSARGGCLAYMGRFDDAAKALDDAQRVSRTATEPLWYRAELDEQQGRCADEEADAHTWLNRDPDDWYGYHYLARALAAEGRPLDTVRTALEQKWARLDADRRAKREPIDRALLDLVAGDFASAERHALDVEKGLAHEPGAQTHAESRLMLMRIAEETGRVDHARDVAQEYLARKDAWTPPQRVDDVSIFLDPVPQMLGALAQVGALPATQLEERRADWLRTWRSKTSASYFGDLWVAGWAAPARTREQAEAALQALPGYGPFPFTPTSSAQAQLGHTYLLAGRLDDALATLRRATAVCTLLVDPISQTRSWEDLGRVLEAKGDRDGACDAYRVVLDRWGRAKPRSLTADRARTRWGALGCH